MVWACKTARGAVTGTDAEKILQSGLRAQVTRDPAKLWREGFAHYNDARVRSLGARVLHGARAGLPSAFLALVEKFV